MKTNYLILITAALLLSCTNEGKKVTENKVEHKKGATKNKKITTDDLFINKQISNLEYQIQAFKIGAEKTANPDLKSYLTTKISEIKDVDAAYKSFATTNGLVLEGISADQQQELYKLTMANTKDFDKVFKLYYKDFLNKTIKNNAATEILNTKLNDLKNQYGNLLYEQKLYFDVLP